MTLPDLTEAFRQSLIVRGHVEDVGPVHGHHVRELRCSAGLPVLLAGRAFQGIACGLAASSIGSWAVDTVPTSRRWLAPLVTSSAPAFGIPLGAIVSGVLVEDAPSPRTLGC